MANRDLSRNRLSTTRGEDHDPRSRRLDHGIHVHRAGGAHYLRPRVRGRRRRLGRTISPESHNIYCRGDFDRELSGRLSPQPVLLERLSISFSATIGVSFHSGDDCMRRRLFVPLLPQFGGAAMGWPAPAGGSSRPFPFLGCLRTRTYFSPIVSLAISTISAGTA